MIYYLCSEFSMCTPTNHGGSSAGAPLSTDEIELNKKFHALPLPTEIYQSAANETMIITTTTIPAHPITFVQSMNTKQQ